ncbi:MAG: hemerythrin domain-containing protein [Bacteroidales bacterium]|nr:hemerythrin domain-containing protein [Bacteroidales bacterium]
MSRYFTAKTKMADALTVNYNIFLLLPRLGIKLGFGDRSIDEVCHSNGVATSFVVILLNIYTFSDYVPEASSLSDDDVTQMLEYLVASHRYYVNERMPHIERHLDHVASQAGERYAAALKTFFSGYCDDVVAHFTYEEQTIFPLIERRKAGGHISRSVVSHMSSTHDSAVDKLSDLMQILFKYLPSEGLAEELNELAFTIMQLSSDLNKHVVIEDNLLIPYLLGKEAERQ